MEQDEKMQQDDLISKRAAISEIDELFRLYNKTLRPDESNAAFEAMSRIKQLQTVDAVPVIRCKDCKYYLPEPWGGGILQIDYMCYNGLGLSKPDDFCSRAERKE